MTFTDTAGRERAVGLDDAGRAALSKARGDQVALVRFLYVDHGGIVRGKSSSLAKLPDRLMTGIGHTLAMMAMSMMDTLQPVDGMGPVGEVRLVPDPSSYVTLPYAPGAGAMLADLVQPDGTPWDGCARTFLKQAVAALAAEGYGLSAAFARASPARGGQPGAVPGDGAGRRVPPRAVGQPGAEADRRPGWQRRALARLALRVGFQWRAGYP